VVLARADGDGHQRLVAYVVKEQRTDAMQVPGGHPAHQESGESPELETPSSELSVSDLREFLKQRLPEYLVPSFFVVLERLPLTPNGKVDRKALPAPDGARPDLRQAYAAPRTDTERTLAEIWSQVTGVAQVGIHDNFFELGGDSILSMQVASRAGQAGLRLTVKDIFEHQTIAELASVAGASQGIVASQEIVTGPVPLTPIQHWFFNKILVDRHHWNMDVLLATQPGVDPALLNEIIQHLMVHHDGLRLCYTQVDGTWQQDNAAPGAPVPFSVVDLSDLPPAEQPVALDRAATELQVSMILDQPPLFRAAFFNLGPDRPGRLYMVMHHLIVDAFSWRVLLEDIQTAYQQLSAGQPIQLPSKTTSYQHWAERLVAHAQSETLRQELPYWLSFDRVPTPLPRDLSDGANTVASNRVVPIMFSPEETRALLQEVPKRYNARMHETILAAIGYAVARWTGDSTVRIDVEGHGREELFSDVDMTRTVGWCPSISPVQLDLDGADTPAAALIRTRDQNRQIPQRGVGYGMLRYLSQDAETRQRLAALPEAEVMLNYFGQFDQVVASSAIFQHMAAEPTGPAGSGNGNRFTVLFVVGQIMQGQLSVLFHYSENLHHRSTIQRVADDFQQMMRSLIGAEPHDEAGAGRPADVGNIAVPA
ncbi:MAG TPA: condensation domain-containing protein, partial [Herpetosiphonaceae bacterium]